VETAALTASVSTPAAAAVAATAVAAAQQQPICGKNGIGGRSLCPVMTGYVLANISYVYIDLCLSV
jgi:hypothetical protein